MLGYNFILPRNVSFVSFSSASGLSSPAERDTRAEVAAATFRHLIANFPLVSFELRQKVLCVEDWLSQPAAERPIHVFNLSLLFHI